MPLTVVAALGSKKTLPKFFLLKKSNFVLTSQMIQGPPPHFKEYVLGAAVPAGFVVHQGLVNFYLSIRSLDN